MTTHEAPPLRMPKQARSRARYDALLRAAVELIAEGGPQAVTHRAVAARANVPPSTAGYFFASIDDLTAEALRVYTAQSTAEFDAIFQQAEREAPRSAAHLIEAIARHRDDPQVALAQIAMYLEASRNPAMRVPVAEAIATYRQQSAAMLASYGMAESDAAAPGVVALLDGFMLHTLAEPDDPPSPAVIANALEALLAGYRHNADGRRRVRARLKPAADGE